MSLPVLENERIEVEASSPKWKGKMERIVNITRRRLARSLVRIEGGEPKNIKRIFPLKAIPGLHKFDEIGEENIERVRRIIRYKCLLEVAKNMKIDPLKLPTLLLDCYNERAQDILREIQATGMRGVDLEIRSNDIMNKNVKRILERVTDRYASFHSAKTRIRGGITEPKAG